MFLSPKTCKWTTGLEIHEWDDDGHRPHGDLIWYIEGTKTEEGPGHKS